MYGEEKLLPLAKPKKVRPQKVKSQLSNEEEYIIIVTNPAGRPLPVLLADTRGVTPHGDDIMALIESFGYDCEIRDKGYDLDE